MKAPARVQHTLIQPHSFDYTTWKNLEDLMMCTFPEKDFLEEESARSLCKSIFSEAVESIKKLDSSGEIARYM